IQDYRRLAPQLIQRHLLGAAPQFPILMRCHTRCVRRISLHQLLGELSASLPPSHRHRGLRRSARKPVVLEKVREPARCLSPNKSRPNSNGGLSGKPVQRNSPCWRSDRFRNRSTHGIGAPIRDRTRPLSVQGDSRCACPTKYTPKRIATEAEIGTVVNSRTTSGFVAAYHLVDNGQKRINVEGLSQVIPSTRGK